MNWWREVVWLEMATGRGIPVPVGAPTRIGEKSPPPTGMGTGTGIDFNPRAGTGPGMGADRPPSPSPLPRFRTSHIDFYTLK